MDVCASLPARRTSLVNIRCFGCTCKAAWAWCGDWRWSRQAVCGSGLCTKRHCAFCHAFVPSLPTLHTLLYSRCAFLASRKEGGGWEDLSGRRDGGFAAARRLLSLLPAVLPPLPSASLPAYSALLRQRGAREACLENRWKSVTGVQAGAGGARQTAPVPRRPSRDGLALSASGRRRGAARRYWRYRA